MAASKAPGNGWELAGKIGIDTGTCWLGDPSYLLAQRPPWLTWDHFLVGLRAAHFPLVREWPYPKGHTGLGVSVTTGWGDGRYPVYVKYIQDGPAKGRVAAVQVVFIEEEDGDDEPEA